MRRFAVGLILLAALLATALANLRAPRSVDGVFSGALGSRLAAAGVRLRAETLRLAFPPVDLSRPNPRETARVEAIYEFDNVSSAPVSFPARFIALDLEDVAVGLDGRPLQARPVESPEDKSECLAALAGHRAAFLPAFYGDFLGRLKSASGLSAETDGDWPARLSGRDLSAVPFSAVFRRMFEEPPAADFPAAEFEILLAPGANRLAVSYKQRLYIEERDHGYFASWPARGFTGFDYLLYPAKSWPMDPAFRLTVSAEVPDVRAKRLFFRTWKRPFLKSNLVFQEDKNPDKHRRLFRAEFAGIPADVLTILLWTDPKAVRHLH